MQQIIKTAYNLKDFTSLQHGETSLELFISDLLRKSENQKQLVFALKIQNISHGASPDILIPELKHVNFDYKLLSGYMSINYQLCLYWGCSASNTQHNLESVWTFKVNTIDKTIEFLSSANSERSTVDEF